MGEQQENICASSASILTIGTGWFPQSPGGLERYVYDLIHTFVAHQDQVELCGIGLPDIQLNTSIKLTNLASPNSPIWQRFWSIRRNFQKTRISKPDAINLHFALYSFPVLDILPKGVPITFNFHGPWALESQQEIKSNPLGILIKRRLIEQTTYSRCDRFVVLSKAFGNILHQKYQIPWSRIHVIPGGVNIHRFQPDSPQIARQQLGWPQNRPILFTSRRLVQRMGLDKLLAAVATIKPKIPDVWLAIAGRGHLQATLEQQIQELGLENNVKLLGFLPDEQLPLAYQAANLTVMPSQSFEGFGLAIVESLACGTPVLCTPIGGMPEILQPFSPQLITNSPETSAIAEKLEQILLEQLPIPSPSDCRQYIINNFDWQKVGQQVREVILA
ncbi:glycosyltransferase family 4 protein [Nostoc sp. CMAA1605]|uniref:glycosyltransferase family 4 protein n=1 Tax=Nostoc sp. CMAA1605 TaxID=2055159 RepID=UPI001F3F665D|nr:glycosyltransferase family 4 protein [Nostoc sp. CMAA1605]MCF4966866.1 group 1 glycosyl transferase [Nostoc sp. CMAA1605]